jgi:hypothetical protein
VKKAKPSSENGSPTSGPACSMKAGNKRPSSKESTVPLTAPTAKNTAVPFAQRFASLRYSASPVRSQSTSAMTINKGIAIPTEAKMMWNASEYAICARA